jgi:hypothetical protein
MDKLLEVVLVLERSKNLEVSNIADFKSENANSNIIVKI